MKHNLKSMSQILGTLKEAAQELQTLQEQLLRHAQAQEVAENNYNALVLLAAEGMGLLNELHIGDTASDAWKERADDIASRVQSYIDQGTDHLDYFDM